MKIGILGMGGVGGFVGAHLAKNFRNDDDTSIIFICRGKTKEAILKKGLTLTAKDGIYNVLPDLVSDDAGEIGILDILIISTKSYALEEAVNEYKSCIDKNTALLPLQNMVNAKELIENCLKNEAKVLEGCIYVASNIAKPGYVNHVGGPGKIFFGSDSDENFQWVADILNKGGINATYTENIKKAVWKKYLFVSPVAAITSAYKITFGQLAEDKTLLNELEKMMNEIQNLAHHSGIQLTDQDVKDSLAMMNNFPYEAKSSLQLDFENRNSQTEKYYLIDYIINHGEINNIKVDTYKKIHEKITK